MLGVERGGERGRRLADQVPAVALTQCCGKLRVALVLAAPPENEVQRRRTKRLDGAKSCRRIRRLGIVDVADATDDGDLLDPVLDAREVPQRPRDRLVGDASRARGRRRRGGVLAVVQTGDPRLGREPIAGCELDDARAARHRAESAREDCRVVLRLLGEHAELRRRVLLEVVVAVEMVGLEIEEHTDSWVEHLYVVELEDPDLADDPRRRVDRPDE